MAVTVARPEFYGVRFSAVAGAFGHSITRVKQYRWDGEVRVNPGFDRASGRPALITLDTVSNGVNGAVTKPVRAIGGFFAMSLDTFVMMFKPPFAWREFLIQIWFVARVSLIPTLLMSIPFCTQVIFNLNILLVDLGAADLSGVGASVGIVNQIGPIVDVLVVAGARATAVCGDLRARPI